MNLRYHKKFLLSYSTCGNCLFNKPCNNSAFLLRDNLKGKFVTNLSSSHLRYLVTREMCNSIYRFSECLCVGSSCEVTIDSVFYNLIYSIYICTDANQSAGHCLQQCFRHSFIKRGQNIIAIPIKNSGHLVIIDNTRKINLCVQLFSVGQQFIVKLAAAVNIKGQPAPGNSFYKVEKIFLRVQTSYKDYSILVFFTISRIKNRRIYIVVNNFNFYRRNIIFRADVLFI